MTICANIGDALQIASGRKQVRDEHPHSMPHCLYNTAGVEVTIPPGTELRLTGPFHEGFITRLRVDGVIRSHVVAPNELDARFVRLAPHSAALLALGNPEALYFRGVIIPLAACVTVSAMVLSFPAA